MALKRPHTLHFILAFAVICIIFIARQSRLDTSASGLQKTALQRDSRRYWIYKVDEQLNDSCIDNSCHPARLDGPHGNPADTPIATGVSPRVEGEQQDVLEEESELSTKPDEKGFLDTEEDDQKVGEEPAAEKLSFTLVTAASANHFCALESMLYALQETKKYVDPEIFPRIVVYDIGLTEQHNQILKNLQSVDFLDELVTFDYAAYPKFWDIRVNRGEYAWKTGIVKQVQERYGGIIVWLDTGDIPNALFMRMIPEYIRRHGFWSPRSTGVVGSKFNHPGIFKYLTIPRKTFETLENCNGAALGFDADNPRIVDEIITPWYECGLDKNCIAPPGSSRLNHRQDQSAITLLALKSGFRCYEYPEFHGITIHQDEYCHQRLLILEERGQLLHPSYLGKQRR